MGAIRPGGGGGASTPPTAEEVADVLGDALQETGVAEGVLEVLHPTTAYDGSSSSGWTANAGLGSAAVSGGVYGIGIPDGETGASAELPSASHPQLTRTIDLGATGRWSILARVVACTGPVEGRLVVWVHDSAKTSGIGVAIGSDGAVQVVTRTLGAGLAWGGNAGAAALSLDGADWIRLDERGAGYGRGTSTDPPTSGWASLCPVAGVATGALARVSVYGYRWGGSGPLAGSVDDFRVRPGT